MRLTSSTVKSVTHLSVGVGLLAAVNKGVCTLPRLASPVLHVASTLLVIGDQ